jgi:hypothetical protein
MLRNFLLFQKTIEMTRPRWFSNGVRPQMLSGLGGPGKQPNGRLERGTKFDAQPAAVAKSRVNPRDAARADNGVRDRAALDTNRAKAVLIRQAKSAHDHSYLRQAGFAPARFFSSFTAWG